MLFSLKKRYFDNKLKNVTSNKNELNELSEKVKVTSTNELTKDLINKFSILNGAKYFSSRIFKNYLVFTPAKKYIKYLVALLGLIRGNLMECQKKVLKMVLNETAIMHQLLLIIIYYQTFIIITRLLMDTVG